MPAMHVSFNSDLLLLPAVMPYSIRHASAMLPFAVQSTVSAIAVNIYWHCAFPDPVCIFAGTDTKDSCRPPQ